MSATRAIRERRVPLLMLVAAAATLLLLPAATAPAAGGASRTYTLNADFDEGTYNNVVHSVPDQLQLDDTTTPFNFIWVAVSTKGTVVKINTESGTILGEYSTSPAGQPKDPSRTTVDLNGNVWATNRAGNSLLHIGLEENGGCVDRNGNGTIETSHAQNDIKPWTNAGGADTNGGVSTAQDECIIHYTRVRASGTRHVSVNASNDVWVSGTGGQQFDLVDGDTGLVVRQEGPVGYGGYGGLIDANGVIWSARPHLRWDTALPLAGPNGGTWRGLNHDSYGLCIGPDGDVWETQLFGNAIRRWNSDGSLQGVFPHGFDTAQGCVVDSDGHVWVAHSILNGGSTVGHLAPSGAFLGNVPVGVGNSGPTGVAEDAAGKIWATNYHNGTVSRIDPSIGVAGAVDFTTVNLGGNPYNYSDMTGSTLSGAPGSGTWEVVYDSTVAGLEWGTIDWNGSTPGDSQLSVTAASSNDGVVFGPPEAATNGGDLSVANGRYLKITVLFNRASSGESPILFDLSVRGANEPPTAEAGGPYVVDEGGSVPLDGTGSADPDGDALSYAWDLDNDGAYDDASGPTPTFSAVGLDGPGSTSVGLQVCDPDGECSTDTAAIAIRNVPPTANAGPDQTVFRNDVVSVSGSWTDPAGSLDDLYAWTWAPGVLPAAGTAAYGSTANGTTSFATEGSYTLTFGVTDKDGGFDDDSMTVTVLNRAPSCASAAPSRSELWPPNHQFVDVSVTGLTDAEGDPVAVTVTGIRQDEPVNGSGDGNTAPDGRGVGTATAEVRAERTGNKNVPGDGRVYHIAFIASDGHGGTCTGTVTVSVPHDRSGDAAVDGGPLYDSTAG